MNHSIDNQYRYGLVYNLDGQIVGFNLSPDVFVGLTDKEIESVLGVYALTNALKLAVNDIESVQRLMTENNTLREEVKNLKERKKQLNKKIKELRKYKKDYEELYYNTSWDQSPDMMGKY